MQGCPIRESPGQSASDYPKLFVACYALHRLQVPRHPPCALSNLTTQSSFFLLPSYFLFLLAFALQRTHFQVSSDECGVTSGYSSSVTHHSSLECCSAKFQFSISLCSFQGAQPTHWRRVLIAPAASVADENRLFPAQL